jgi:Fe-S oxidoreductase
MSATERVIFAVVLTIAVCIFLISVYRLIRLFALGRPDGRLKRGLADLVHRVYSTVVYAFLQRRVVSVGFGINHFILFWGFMVLFLANAEFIVSGLFPSLSFTLLGPVYPVLTAAFDIMSLIVLICVVVAVFRRVVVRPSHIDAISFDAFLILGLVAGLMIAFFGMHGAEFALGETHERFFMPVTERFVAPLMVSIFGGSLPVAGRVFWWLHAVIFLFFLNYLPYSKHMHILTAIPNVFCRSFERMASVGREEFAVGRVYGAPSIEEFTWKDLLDFTACTECGRCNLNCPATNSGKTLNPRHVIQDGKHNLLDNGKKIISGKGRDDGLSPLIGNDNETLGTVGQDALWACTTCGACMANCPEFIEHVPKIVKMRRHLVENEAEFPEELHVFFEAIEQRSNPWGIIPSDRAKWAKDIDVPLFSSGKRFEYLFFVGCAGAFDSRNKKVAVATATILKKAGVSFAILGTEENCCGDSLRRLGNEFVFEQMAAQNVELFNRYKVKKIVTYCPHCYTTLKNDYRQYGFEAEVIHHTELIDDLIRKGKLKVSAGDDLGRVVFHDSCYLGRYNDIYRQPRDIVSASTGKKPVEMDRIHAKSFCCGAGGGRMWMEESPEHRLNLNRVREALTKKPDTIAVACPYCMTMFEDGLKDEKADRVHVLDIAEIVAGKLKG